MPKVQKQLSRKVGDKEYSKYVVTLPKELLEKHNVQEGDEITISIKKIVKNNPQNDKIEHKKYGRVKRVNKSGQFIDKD